MHFGSMCTIKALITGPPLHEYGHGTSYKHVCLLATSQLSITFATAIAFSISAPFFPAKYYIHHCSEKSEFLTRAALIYTSVSN